MSYQKQNFANGEVLTAAQLNHIENGIVDVESAANTTKGVVDKIIDPTLSVSGKAADAAKVGEAVNAETERAKGVEGQIKEDLVDLDSAVFTQNINIFDKDNITIGKAPNTNSGKTLTDFVISKSKFVSNQVFDVAVGDIIYCNTGWGLFAIYDIDGKYIGKINNAELHNEITFENAKYMLYSSNNSSAYVDNFMLSINTPLPEEYIPFGKTSNIENNTSNIEKLNKELHPDNIPIIILDFDQEIETNDVRVTLMEQYGWKPSFVGGVTKEITKALLAKGWDLSTYWNKSNVPTDAQLSGAEESDLEACKLYVKTALEAQEADGFFNPVSWSCRQNKYGETLGKALQFYGYKICRGGGNNGFDQNISEIFTRTNATGIYSNNLSTVKSAIGEAIKNNQAINIFTHFVVETEAEDRGYDCLKTVYVELLNHIKDLETQGKVIVMNYREFYSLKHPQSAYECDYNRFVKRMNYIDSHTSN